MTDAAPYNPLDKRNLGASVAEALLGRKLHPLGAIGSFTGAGIYAIYYGGTFAPYARIAQRNQGPDPTAPIYVGKAIPQGGRKGAGGLETSASRALCRRLAEHADSVRSAPNLHIDDFACRYLAVDDIWIPLGESLLIAKFMPLWNNLIDGFGNHDPGGGRYAGLCPRWDVLHPGRGWAAKCKPRGETAQQIAAEVAAHLELTAPPPSPHFLVEQGLRSYGASAPPITPSPETPAPSPRR